VVWKLAPPEENEMGAMTKERLTRCTLIPSVLLVVTALCLPAVADTLILQQGQDGYTGCTDTYIRRDGYSTGNGQNYGNNASMHVRCEHYNPG